MKEYTLKIDGMMCPMCEAHVNDSIRNHFTVKKVEASHTKKQCVIIADELDEEKLKSVIAETGYQLLSVEAQPYEKKGFFSKFGKK